MTAIHSTVVEPADARTPIEDVFVSLDMATDLAYVVCPSASGLLRKEVSRADGELLSALGASSQVHLSSGAQGEASAFDRAVPTASRGVIS